MKDIDYFGLIFLLFGSLHLYLWGLIASNIWIARLDHTRSDYLKPIL